MATHLETTDDVTFHIKNMQRIRALMKRREKLDAEIDQLKSEAAKAS